MRRILIVDDSSMIRSSLRSWFEKSSDWQICGEAENGQMAIQKVDELHPDLVILDFQMPGMNGLEAARQINDRAPQTAMLMFTMHPSGELLRAARQAGVRDVVSKCDQPLRPYVPSSEADLCLILPALDTRSLTRMGNSSRKAAQIFPARLTLLYLSLYTQRNTA